MKKRDLSKLALMGLVAGLCMTEPLHAKDKSSKEEKSSAKVNASDSTNENDSSEYADDSSSNPNDENIGYHLMTEDELMEYLNEKTKKLYYSLSPEGKKMALEVASQRCNKTNSCKGLNACETPENACAGKGTCKGTSKCAFADKNLAVKVVAKKMAEKRENAANAPSNEQNSDDQ